MSRPPAMIAAGSRSASTSSISTALYILWHSVVCSNNVNIMSNLQDLCFVPGNGYGVGLAIMNKVRHGIVDYKTRFIMKL